MSQVSLLSSTQVSNRDAIPPVLTNPSFAGARIQKAYGFVTCLTADTTASIYRMVSLPSNCMLSALKLGFDALSASTTLDMGAYYGNDFYANRALLGTVINATFFASAIAATSALALTDEINQAGNVGFDIRQQPLWQMLGIAADPECHIDITVVPHVAIVAGGKIGVEATFTI